MKIIQLLCITVALLFAGMGCEEDSYTPEILSAKSDLNRKTTGEREINDLADQQNDQRIPYPKIIQKTFIPENDLFDHTKCVTWRIEWPIYSDSVDPDKIPTVFSINNGALHSFNFLNSVSPAQTQNAQFSLYDDSKLRIVANMWAYLDYYWTTDEITDFAKVNKSASTIEEWVKGRPGLFEINWPGGDATELEYQEGDIIFFKNNTQGLYGGIRVVSMIPRVIEIYLAVENL